MNTSSSAIFCGLAGAATALVFSSAGAAYGTAKTCRGIMESNTIDMIQEQPIHNELGSTAGAYGCSLPSESLLPSNVPQAKSIGMKCMIPIVIAGVLALYGLIYAVITAQAVTAPGFTISQGYAYLFGGITVGLCCLVSGIAVGVCGENGMHLATRAPKMLTTVVLALIYCEAIGLYGLIFGLIAQSMQF